MEEEICKYYREIINYIDIRLLYEYNSHAETLILCYKTKGDFLRYMPECTDNINEDARKNAEASYKVVTLKIKPKL